jgi:macrolide-specific efflux system membrane fusion protein
MKKSRLLMMAGLAVVVVVGVFLAVRGKHKSPSGTLSAAQATEGPIEETVEATGEVAPLNRVEIKPPIQGRVEKLLVDEGAVVQGGQTLAWMSSTDRAAILDAARAQGPEAYRHWQDAYKPTPIVAPLSGVIILKNVVVGQTVDPATVLYAMSDKLIVVAQVDESDIGRIKVGMPARITLDAYPNSPQEGEVFQILEEGKNVSNVITYDVKIKPENAPPFFRSQMTANVDFILQKKEKAVLVPTAAVRESRSGSGEKEVLVPGPNGQPVSQTVQTGIDNGDQVEVLSGLKPGDSILIRRIAYTPQQGPQASPLTMGGRPSTNPKPSR